VLLRCVCVCVCVCVLCHQDACCETPSDWLDAGQSDLYVPTVPAGFVREVVIDPQRCTRAVYYHFFEEVTGWVGRWRAVRETALLRAATSEDGAQAAHTVGGFMRSHPHVRVGMLDFNFRTDASTGKAIAPRGKAAASTSKAALSKAARAPPAVRKARHSTKKAISQQRARRDAATTAKAAPKAAKAVLSKAATETAAEETKAAPTSCVALLTRGRRDRATFVSYQEKTNAGFLGLVPKRCRS
jgi:hypothetical protein